MKPPSQETIAKYREGCYSGKNPDDCHTLGVFIKQVEKDLLKAVKLFKVNCDEYKHAQSCLEYGNVAFGGVKEQNVKSDPIEALKYFEKGCSFGSSENCLNSGLLLVSPLLERSALPRDLPKGMDYLTKSCNMDNGNACFYLSGIYMSGTDALKPVQNNEQPAVVEKSTFVLEKDMKKAFELTTKACSLNNFFACANLSNMYARGDGTEKNLEKSEEFKQKADKLRDEMNRRRILNSFSHP